ncbi:MTH865-like family protein [Methanobrevibacter cuticularis]|uniref:MTH865-like family protein n=1 Tax=Methanobrevibacter cuticularis TaxID=47311 RepID=A0A166DGA5_9EURY|nr:MTH865 family protein [Methanobrevibacter cuticularis]KZX15573.1 MTH865-like family protein [Methanobrevibacter cuticularis]
MSAKEEIHGQIVGALAGAKFPIKNPDELFNALPDGQNTTCKSGDVVLKASDAGKVLSSDDFPFSSAEEVATTIVDKAGL